MPVFPIDNIIFLQMLYNKIKRIISENQHIFTINKKLLSIRTKNIKNVKSQNQFCKTLIKLLIQKSTIIMEC